MLPSFAFAFGAAEDKPRPAQKQSIVLILKQEAGHNWQATANVLYFERSRSQIRKICFCFMGVYRVCLMLVASVILDSTARKIYTTSLFGTNTYILQLLPVVFFTVIIRPEKQGKKTESSSRETKKQRHFLNFMRIHAGGRSVQRAAESRQPAALTPDARRRTHPRGLEEETPEQTWAVAGFVRLTVAGASPFLDKGSLY